MAWDLLGEFCPTHAEALEGVAAFGPMHWMKIGLSTQRLGRILRHKSGEEPNGTAE
jgi:hypothetical protein